LEESSYLIWGLEDKKEILSWDSRIRILGVHYYYQTGVAGIRNRLLGKLSDFLGVQYMIHLKLGGGA
jgi:hypothetical protein